MNKLINYEMNRLKSINILDIPYLKRYISYLFDFLIDLIYDFYTKCLSK